MKKCFFHAKNLPTMKNHAIPSSTPLGTTNKSPMKRTIISKNKHKHKKHNTNHLIFNKVVSYLISDCHMYNPLISPQPTFDFAPPKQIFGSHGVQEDVALKIEGRNKKLIEKVVDFLEADCYLYAPLITDDHVDVCCKSHAADKCSGGQGRKGTVQEGDGLSRSLHARPVVKKTVAYRESVKRMVR